jgi:LysM repeat protein
MPNTEYRIAPGDTLAVIAQRYNVTVDVLSRINGISNPNKIRAGQLLKIPQSGPSLSSAPQEPTTHRVCAGETLAKIADKYDLTVEALVQANNITNPNQIFVGQVLKLQATAGSNGTTSNGTNGTRPGNITLPISSTKTQQTNTSTTSTTSTTSSGTTTSGNALMEVAFRITGVFEGGKATSYQNEDDGIVSYGKHQATLASGTLGTILAKYVKRSTNPAAQELAGFMDRVNRKESSLRNDAGFKKALLAAGADPVMNVVQDEVFAQSYWPTAEQGVKSDTLKSPLAHAMYYDTNIQGGLASVRKETAKAMKGKPFSEAAYLTEFNKQRDLRLHNLAEEKLKAAEDASGEKKKRLLSQAQWLEASRVRITALQALVASGDLQLRGDANGMLQINGRKVPGLAAGSGGGKTSTFPDTNTSKTTVDASKNGTAQSQGINLKDIARNVHDAMEDGYLQTDEDKVYVNLARLNHDAALIKEFKALYKATYKVDVVEHIKSEFSNTWAYGNELDRALSYLQPQSTQPKTGNNTQPKTGNNTQPKTGNNTQVTKKSDTPPTGAPEKSGKHWVSRFLPSNKLSDLKEPFQSNVKKFFAALTAGGITYDINTTLRPPQRSYLMYYAREVTSGRLTPDKVPAFVPQGGDAPVNIDWAHKDNSGKADLAAAKKAAAEMDKAYAAAGAIGKPYKSNHNGGEAIDVDFSPAWGIGKNVVDAKGNTVAIRSKKDIINVGATFGVLHWNYAGPKDKNDDPHWSKTGN